MVRSQRILTSSNVLGFALLLALAEGHFLTSVHSLHSASKHALQVAVPEADKAEPQAEPKADLKAEPQAEPEVSDSERDRKKYEKQISHPPGEKPKYPFIAACHKPLEKVFGRYTEAWYEDWKLWIGASLWLSVWMKWLLRGYDEVYYQRGLFCFGINIVILHILQYSSSIKIGMLCVSALLAAQIVFQSYLDFQSTKEEAAIAESDGLEDFECETLYLDLSLPPEQIVVLFVAQCCIWWFYMTSIVHNFNFSHVNYMYWAVAYLSMQMTMIFNRGEDSVLGKAFPCYEVWLLVKTSGQIKVQHKQSGSGHFRLSKVDLFMRGVMGFWVNGICREIMAYTIPLMLMGFEQPMDFVVYCVGVNFICTLDDMNEKTFEMQVTHRLRVGDLVLARKPDNRQEKLNPWLAGTVLSIDLKTELCTVSYSDGTTSDKVEENEIYYAPDRDEKWSSPAVPPEASPIHLKGD